MKNDNIFLIVSTRLINALTSMPRGEGEVGRRHRYPPRHERVEKGHELLPAVASGDVHHEEPVVLVEKTKPMPAEWAAPPVPKLSIVAKLHQHGYDKRAASAAMFALQLPALDWTEHHLRRAVEYLETHCH